jgi:class 3 adenylate cyclase
MSWKESLDEKMNSLANTEFDYTETSDIQKAANIGLDNSGIYMEATVIYFEIKNIVYILKENGRRKAAQAYTMYSEVLSAIAAQTGGFLNSFSPNAFLVIYPGKDDSLMKAVTGALKISYALTETYKHQFSSINGLEFAMGLDHGHIMGTKTISDNGMETLSWFGTSIYKASRICKECARPFYVGTSGIVYHNLGEGLKTTTRRILGIKKSVDMWTKVTYNYENVKKHLYQTNHKISIEEE